MRAFVATSQGYVDIDPAPEQALAACENLRLGCSPDHGGQSSLCPLLSVSVPLADGRLSAPIRSSIAGEPRSGIGGAFRPLTTARYRPKRPWRLRGSNQNALPPFRYGVTLVREQDGRTTHEKDRADGGLRSGRSSVSFWLTEWAAETASTCATFYRSHSDGCITPRENELRMFRARYSKGGRLA